jgi:hypothetical protein
MFEAGSQIRRAGWRDSELKVKVKREEGKFVIYAYFPNENSHMLSPWCETTLSTDSLFADDWEIAE